MICRYCGKTLANGVAFCGGCGRNLSPPAVEASRPARAMKAPPMSRRMRILLGAFYIFVVGASAAVHWWSTRPEGPYRQDNSGLYPLVQDGKYGYMDKSGRMVISPQFDGAENFFEGLAAVRIGDKVGFIDVKGTLVILPQFADAEEFKYGRAGVKMCCSKWNERH